MFKFGQEYLSLQFMMDTGARNALIF